MHVCPALHTPRFFLWRFVSLSPPPFFFAGNKSNAPARTRTHTHSAYGAVFKLSTKIGDTIAYTDPMTGDEVLSCFGFDGDRYWADLGVLAAVGGCGLALAFVFLKRSRA